jgi:hypothetical protein
MDTSSQPKKQQSRPRRSKKRDEIVSTAIERNAWNPFERVDPRILEMLHRKHERNAENTRRYFLLSEPGKAGVHQTEDAPV